MRRLLVIFVFFLLLPLFTGCATLKELPKKIWGSSTQALEQARAEGVSNTFSLDYETSFNKVIEILKKMDCYIHIKNKKRHLIVAMKFQGPDDTTEVGIFFTPLEKVAPKLRDGKNRENSLTGFTEKDPEVTEIELSCLSSSLLNYASEKIFSMMNEIDEDNEEEVE